MITNHQRRVRVALAPLERYFSRVLRVLELSSDAASVRFVNDSQMARWNRAYRGKRGSTDVLSFPAERQRESRTPSHCLKFGIGDAELALRRATNISGTLRSRL